MTNSRTTRHALVGLALVLLLALGAIAGCTKSSTPTTSSSAKSAFTLAMSALSTAAPDGKLLVTQAADTLTPTSTPSWEFLVGSPKTNVIYAVTVKDGKAQFQEYGTAGLSAAEWDAVPSADAWKVDSPEARAKALTIYPNGKSANYYMGFVTYVPKSAGDTTTKPMTWIVTFDPASQGSAPTTTVNVDVGTGAAAYAK